MSLIDVMTTAAVTIPFLPLQTCQGPHPPVLCVSIHDVAPATWRQCEHLLQAIRVVANIPVTLLVVPAYHRQAASVSPRYERGLEQCLDQGSELALHGYTHRDDMPLPTTWRAYFLRRVYTLGEGEFSALDVAEATRRLELGLAWFAQRHWPVEGFVAPAWLLGDDAWSALRQFDFRYTTTHACFYWLPQRVRLFSPSLVYAARNGPGRMLSRRMNSMLACVRRDAALLRLSLHPCDADHPQLVAHFQCLLEKLLCTHTAMTKAAFAQTWLTTPH
jgi:predicted deacetylase